MNEEDLATLIYKTSKTARARAAVTAAVAAKEKGQNTPLGRRTATRKRSVANRDDGASTSDRPTKKRNVRVKRQLSSKNDGKDKGKRVWGNCSKICSADGCTNLIIKGGVCIRHGAKIVAAVKDAQI